MHLHILSLITWIIYTYTFEFESVFGVLAIAADLKVLPSKKNQWVGEEFDLKWSIVFDILVPMADKLKHWYLCPCQK